MPRLLRMNDSATQSTTRRGLGLLAGTMSSSIEHKRPGTANAVVADQHRHRLHAEVSQWLRWRIVDQVEDIDVNVSRVQKLDVGELQRSEATISRIRVQVGEPHVVLDLATVLDLRFQKPMT